MPKETDSQGNDRRKYQKLYNWGRTLITSGVIKNGALAQLEEEGLISRVKGSGTYVSYNDTGADEEKPRIGLILSYFSDYLFPQVYEGIKSVLDDKGYIIEVAVTRNRLNDEAMFLEGLLRKNLAGMILEGTRSRFHNPNI